MSTPFVSVLALRSHTKSWGDCCRGVAIHVRDSAQLENGETMGTAKDDLAPEMEALKAKLKATWMSGDFDKIAQIYAPGAAEFVERLALRPGERVLGVACGTGNLSFPASGTGARVVGLDIAPNLLETARARALAEGLEIRFDEGDAEQLPYEDAAFDTVITMFRAMFAPWCLFERLFIYSGILWLSLQFNPGGTNND